mmetsp:Transcript_28081/g.37490  ORF Transcript_28081/g.37490 Transcript_28081/m.37490 type:complete len:100 (-) Transcript_28081:83-382(-)
MDPGDLKLIIGYVDDAKDLERALTLTGNNGRQLLELTTKVDDFKQLVILLEKSGGNGAMLQRLLPKVKSPNELIKLFGRVDDAIEELLKMSNDELNTLP